MLDFVFQRKSESGEPNHESGINADIRPTRKHTWSMMHAHLAVMDGFCFDTSNEVLNFLPGDRTRVALTSIGIRSLAELAPELLPDISKEHILDKSKADGLGKTLACLQAIWFCAQCISRLASGLSITLLELNTFAHALCALLAYAFWWSKPHDANEPVLIQGPAMHTICAAMCMRSRIGAEHASNGFFPGDQQVGRIWEEGLGVACPVDFGLPESLVLHQASGESIPRLIYSEVHLDNVPDATVLCSQGQKLDPRVIPKVRLYMGQSLFGFGFRRCWSMKKKIKEVGILQIRRPFIDLSPSNVLLWRLASQGLQNYPNLLHFPIEHDYGLSYRYDNSTQKIHRRFRTEFCTHRVSNNAASAVAESNEDLMRVLYTFLIAGLVYGLLHLSAWNAPFRSNVEAILWRLSAITLTVSGFVPLSVLGSILVKDDIVVDKLERRHPVVVKLIIGSLVVWILSVFTYIVVIGFMLLDLFSRVYLIVECFLKLPYLPPTALSMPQWSQYFSHIM